MSKKGFSFIELVVVMGVIGISLPVLFAIFFGVASQQVKIQRLSEVKRQGDYVLNVMETIIRNEAKNIFQGYSTPTFSNERCTGTPTDKLYQSTDGTSFYFKDKSGNEFRFYYDVLDEKIASESSKFSPPWDLTSSNVRISNFVISCTRNSVGTPPIVTVSFDADYNTDSTRVEEITAVLHYQTSIKLRN